MQALDVAKSVKTLSSLLCISLEETWESHVEENIKKKHAWEDIKKIVDTFQSPEDYDITKS